MAAFKYRSIELSSRIKRNANPQTYYKFDLIDICFINTYQVWSINVTLFSMSIKFMYFKNKE